MEEAAKKPARISATLFLERQAPIDYRVMIERVGSSLGIDTAIMDHQKPDAPMVIPADGDLIFGMPKYSPVPGTAATTGTVRLLVAECF